MPEPVTVPLPAADQLRFPLPSVIRTFVFDPGPVGRLNVQFEVACVPIVVLKFPDAGNRLIVPAVPDSPNVGVTVHVEAVVLDVFGIAPADGADVVFVPPLAIVTVGKSAAARAHRATVVAPPQVPITSSAVCPVA